MNWTTHYPTESGYYWLRNYRIKLWGTADPEPVLEPIIVELNDGDIYWLGSEISCNTEDVLSAEWHGPIQPPVEQEDN